MNEMTLTINALVTVATLFLLYALFGEFLGAPIEPVTTTVPNATNKKQLLSARSLSAAAQRRPSNPTYN